MSAVAPPAAERARDRNRLQRMRASAAAGGAAVLGATPHVLHHVGPLAGAALLAGASGKVLFGALALVLAIPMLRRLRHRHGSWGLPAGVLALMGVAFALSTFVIGPALAGGGDSAGTTRYPDEHREDAPPSRHERHHR